MTKNLIDEIQITYKRSPNKENVKISSSMEAEFYLRKHWNLETIDLFEEFKMIVLNHANEALGIYSVSKGGVNSTIVEIKHILYIALKTNSTGIIIAHNHPSGNLKPSESDKKITAKIKESSRIMDLELLDHIILSRNAYFSFKDEGML